MIIADGGRLIPGPRPVTAGGPGLNLKCVHFLLPWRQVLHTNPGATGAT